MPTGQYERTLEHRNKISKTLKQHIRTKEHIANCRKALLRNQHAKGSIRTPESIQKQLATKRRKNSLTYKLINKLRKLFY